MLNSAQEKQDKAFIARVEDLFSAAAKKYQPRFSAFLDLHQQKIASQIAATYPADRWLFFGGYETAQRVMLGTFPPYEPASSDDFPTIAMTIRFRKEDQISHRDLLGSMLALGIKRETVGDILVEQGLAVCFLTEPAARIIEQELCKVGRYGVKLSRGKPQNLPLAHRYQPCSLQVSSLRLDCVIAALCNISREKAAQVVRSKTVQVDSIPMEEVSFHISEGNVLSVRGYGKFLFEKIERTTRSGRLVVLLEKYI